MTRYRARGASFYLALTLLGFMLLLAGIHAANAQGAPSGALIDPYIVDGRYQQFGDSIELNNAGDWVELRGPISIWVDTWVSDFWPEEDYIALAAGETRKIVNDRTDGIKISVSLDSINSAGTTTTTKATTTTLSAEQYGLELLGLVFGTSGAEIDTYVQANAAPGSSPLDTWVDAGRVFDEATQESGLNPKGLETARIAVQQMALLAAYKDSAGKPPFPSLHNKGVQALLTRMALGAGQSEKNKTAFKNLCLILVGMDMAAYKPPA